MIHTQYLENKKQWTAFTTIGGLDVNELGATEKEALEKLKERIAGSKYLLENIKTPPSPLNEIDK